MRFTIFLWSISFLSIASSLANENAIHEKRAAHTKTFKYHRRASEDHSFKLKVYLQQGNLENLEGYLYKTFDPSSESYGQLWSAEDVRNAFMPSDQSSVLVKQWLEDELDPERIGDKVRLSSGGTHVVAHVTVKEAERLFNTQYKVYQHIDGTEHLACDHYSIPLHVKPHVDIISPGVNLIPRARSQIRSESLHRRFPVIPGPEPIITPLAIPLDTFPSAGNLSGCSTMITPDCLRALYDINYRPKNIRKNTFAVVELTPQSYVPADLQMFFEQFSLASVGQVPIFDSIDGGVLVNGTSFHGESNLDLEYGMALTAPQPVQLYQAGDLIEGSSFTNILDALDSTYCGGDNPLFDAIYPDTAPGGFDEPATCGMFTPAHVISISYGGDEPDVTAAYQERECAEYGKLGLMGTTFLFASGDSGVAGNFNFCIEPNGTQTADGIRFNPGYPSTCPFITAVGATQIDDGLTVHDPEVAVHDIFFSGGGFSDVYALPAYQRADVSSFLEKHPPPYTAAQFNNSGNSRAYPDISANGLHYVFAINGAFKLIDGTSASTPTTASMITLINDARIGIGKKPVGFINPALYSPGFRNAFHDITSGSNPGCGTQGFTAVPGWDPVTGLGTPNFPKLLEAFLLLP